jgi:hypothetical protein
MVVTIDCIASTALLVEFWMAAICCLMSNGFYAQQLSRYFDLFRREQILVVIFDQITADPANWLKIVFEFLGVDPDISIPEATMRTKVNVATPPHQDTKLKRMSLFEQIARARSRPCERPTEGSLHTRVPSRVRTLPGNIHR